MRKARGVTSRGKPGSDTVRAFLRHSAGGVTGTYVAAGPKEAARAHTWLTGAETEERAAEEW